MSNARKVAKLIVGTEVRVTGVDSDISTNITNVKARLDSDDAAIQAANTLAVNSTGEGLTDSDLKVVADLRSQLDSEILSVRNLSLSYTNYFYTATAGQTAFTGSDDNSATLSYTAGGIQVFLNGVILDPNTDYTATDGTTVTLTEAAAVGHQLSILTAAVKSTYAPTSGGTYAETIYNWETISRDDQGMTYGGGTAEREFGTTCDISDDGTYVVAVHANSAGGNVGDSDLGLLVIYKGTGDSDGGAQDYEFHQVFTDSDAYFDSNNTIVGSVAFNGGTSSVESATYLFVGSPKMGGQYPGDSARTSVGGFIVYKRTGTTFELVSRRRIADFKDDGQTTNNRRYGAMGQGIAVSDDGVYVAICAFNTDRVLFYKKKDGVDEWDIVNNAYEFSTGESYFGTASNGGYGGVAMSGDGVYVSFSSGLAGSESVGRSGDMVVFKREDSDNGSEYTIEATRSDIAPHNGYIASEGFGKSTALNYDGTIMAVGAGYPMGQAGIAGDGYVEIWGRSGSTWSRKQIVVIHTIKSNGYQYEDFGYSVNFDRNAENLIVGCHKVQLSGGTSAFSGYSGDGSTTASGDAGYAYIYRKRDSDNGYEYEPANVFRHGLPVTGEASFFNDTAPGNSGGVSGLNDNNSEYGAIVRMGNLGQYAVIGARQFRNEEGKEAYGRVFVAKATGTENKYT